MSNLVQRVACCEFSDAGGSDPAIIPDKPTEFPSDINGDWLGWATSSPLLWLFLYLLFLGLVSWFVFNASKKAVIERRAIWIGYQPDLGLGRRVKLWVGRMSRLGYDRKLTGAEWLWGHVNKALHKAWLAPPERKHELAADALTAYESSMQHTLTVSRALNKAMGNLNKAVEGQKEVDPPKSGHAFSSTGTVINIAVNQGNTVSAQGDATQANHATTPHDGEAPKPEAKPVEPMTPEEQRKAIWVTIDKLHAHWKNEMQIIALFVQAQKQLTRADAFAWPENEERPARNNSDSRGGKPARAGGEH